MLRFRPRRNPADRPDPSSANCSYASELKTAVIGSSRVAAARKDRLPGAENPTSWQGQTTIERWLDRQLARTTNPRRAAVVIAVARHGGVSLAEYFNRIDERSNGSKLLLASASAVPARRPRGFEIAPP